MIARMRLLVSGATDTLRRYQDSPHLGVLLVPKAGNSLRSVLDMELPWAADNAAFTGFDAAAFCGMLGRLAGYPRCLFVACPDVVGDAAATLRLFSVWQPILHQLGVPVALVGQDGAEDLPLPWGRFQVLFLGGSTEWKLGAGAARLAAEAKRRGCYVHMGRCNTLKRFRHAYRLGCDSVDGSGFSRWPDERIPAALRWLADLHGTVAPSPSRRNVAHRFLKTKAAAPSLFDHSGWVVTRALAVDAGYRVYTRHVREPEACPRCHVDGRMTAMVHRHGKLPLVVRDVPRGDRPVTVCIERQRYRCRICRMTFLQPLPGISEQGRHSEALAAYIQRLTANRSYMDVAREVGLHEKTIRNLLAVR
jgi:transposase-like protein